LVSVLQLGAAAAVLARLGRGRKRRAPLAPVGGGTSEAVSVVVPARDEAGRIGPCLEALVADISVGEVLVVDDRSEDGTAEVARGLGARVVAGEPLPEGWVGKQWALQQGLEAAQGPIVVFLDADTRPGPGLVGALAAELEGSDVVSAAPRFICSSAAQRALHPSMLATLTYRFGALGAEGPGPPAHRVVGNGQCLVARREPLLRTDALRRTRRHMTDDIAFLRALAGDGWRVAFVDGADLLAVEMYASAREAWREWPRTLAMADVTSPAWRALDLGGLWLTMALPAVRLLRGRTGWLDRSLLAVRFALLGALGRFYRPRGAAFWMSPLLDPAAVARLTWATVRPVRAWRGRTYRTST
jgi:dolichol-phosphate mannosyltransferase